MIFGLLNRCDGAAPTALAAKLRDLTISWSRYSYHESIIAGDSIAAILNQAADEGHDYCFIQTCGNVIRESWRPFAEGSGDLVSFLHQWATDHKFFVAGIITQTDEGSFGLDTRCLLVDLQKYAELERPDFTDLCRGGEPCSMPTVERTGNGNLVLYPSGKTQVRTSINQGAGFIDASLGHGIPVFGLADELCGATLNLAPESAENEAAFARYLGSEIGDYTAGYADELLTAQQRAFLDGLSQQTARARKGVFLWNIESYADVEVCAEDFEGPITALYSVGAGFKPNRILSTHGFDEQTKVVFFDYSRNALEIKKCLVEEWDGTDFPHFIRYLFRKFPEPHTFYQLWCDVSPDKIGNDDLENMWRRELDRWAGERAFEEHWQAYRRLPHDFVCCDIMTQPSWLIERIVPEPRSVIWWSNAFFTMQGNWFYDLQRRRQMYETWINLLASRNPDLCLFGSDYNNISVNGIQAGEYFNNYNALGGDWLRPCKLHRQKIRS